MGATGYVSATGDTRKVDVAGDTMTGDLVLLDSTPDTALSAASRGYVDAVVGGGAGAIPLTQKGAPGGVATLDGTTLIPHAQIPPLTGADITSGTVAYPRLPVGTTASTVAAGDDARITGAASATDLAAAVALLVPQTDVGAPGGVASLDGAGLLPHTQVPPLGGADITSGTVAYARLPVGTTPATVAAGDDARITGAASTGDLTAATALLIPLSQKGTAAGVATLDGATLLPHAQLPALAGEDITSGTVAYARLPVGNTASTVAAGNDARIADAASATDLAAATALLVPLTQKGAAGGVATLDGASLLPHAQLPALAGADITSGTVAYAHLPVGTTPSTVAAGDDPRIISGPVSAGDLAAAVALLVPTVDVGAPGGVASLDGAGLLPHAQVPPLAGADITSGTVAAARLPVGTAAATVAAGDDARITGAASTTALNAAAALLIPLTQKGAPGGVATLDGATLLPHAQVPPLAGADITSGTVAYARHPVGTTASTLAAGDDVRIVGAASTTALNAAAALLVPLTQKGAAGGVATLDGASLLPHAQLPALAGADITSGTVAYARHPVGTTASTLAAGDDSRIAGAATAAALTAGLATKVTRGELVLSVKDYGAVGDGVTNDTAAVIAAAAAVSAAVRPGIAGSIKHPGAVLFFAPGVYNLATLAAPIVVTGNVDSAGAQLLVPAAYADVVLTIGHPTTGVILQSAEISLPDIMKNATGIVAGSVGVLVRNLYSSRVRFGRIAFFEKGIRLSGLGEGVVYNEINIGWIGYSKIAVELKPDTGGWVNQNTFVGGGIQQSPGYVGGEKRVSGWRHLNIDGTQSIVDGNTFVGVSFEGDVSEYTLYAKYAFRNIWVGCRHETGTSYVPVTVSGSTITSVAHNYVTGDMIAFTAYVSTPGGMLLLSPYYVVSTTVDSYTVSQKRGGTAITFSSSGSSVVSTRPQRVYFDNSGSGCVNNVLRDINNPMGSFLDVVQSTDYVRGSGTESPEAVVSDVYTASDAPKFRARNGNTAAAVRPLFAAYAPSKNPLDDPGGWAVALSDRGVVWNAGQLISSGSGSPEAVLTAPVGSLYLRTDGGAGTSLYVKQTGSGNTGWVAVHPDTDAVTSVAGRTGAVVLARADVGLGSADDTADSAKPVSTAQATADALRVLKSGDTMTGLLALPSGAGGTGGLTIGVDVNLYRSAADVLATDDKLALLRNASSYSMTIVNPHASGAGFTIVLGAANSTAFAAAGSADANLRFQFNASGKMIWGDGTAAPDTNLYRAAAGRLVSDHKLSVSGTTATWSSGTGSPETVVTAPVGSIYTRTDGGANTTLYVKESGAAATGWVAK